MARAKKQTMKRRSTKRQVLKRMTNPLVSIIILNYNGKRFLKGCIDAVLKQKIQIPRSLGGRQNADFEIILVDNNSADDSVAYVEKLYAKEIARGKLLLIANEKNDGFAEGNNVGARAARGEYLVLLNNDTKVYQGWLAENLKTIKSNKGRLGGQPLLIVGGLGYVKASKAYQKWFYRESDLGMTMNLCGEVVSRKRMPYDNDRLVSCFYAGGVSLIFKRKEFPEPFDPNYFAYAEDTYLGWLAQLRGGEVAIAPHAELDHYGGSTKRSSKWINKVSVFNGTKNQLMNFLIFYEWKNIFRIAPLFALTQLGHIIHDPRKIIVKFKAYVWVLLSIFRILKKRRGIQRQRRVPDKVLLRKMSCKFMEPVTIKEEVPQGFTRFVNKLFYAYCWLLRIKTAEFYEH